MPYAQRTMLNVNIDSQRRWARRPREVELTDAVHPTTAGPEDAVATERLIAPLIRSLPPSQRAVVVLRFWEDLSIEQTAQVLGTSPGNVKSQTHRALAKIRDCLASESVR